MALNFPNAPADGEIFAAPNGVLYRWDAAGGLWLQWGAGRNAAIIGEVPPDDPGAGQLWWSAVLGELFIFFDGAWVPASPSTTAPGIIQDFGGLIVPGGWYACDGALKDRIVDAPLFAAISTQHGEGDGETTFALPDLRGRVTAMVDGGSGRLSTVDDEVGATGGTDTHSLTAGENGPHAHAYYDPGHIHTPLGAPGTPFVTANSGSAYWQGLEPGSAALYYANSTNTAATGITISSSGSGAAHQNTQPTMAVNKIIKR